VSVGVGAIVFLLTFVLPRFAVIFSDLGQALPLPTRILLGFSEGLVAYWWIIVLLLVGGLLGWQLLTRSEAGRVAVDRWLLGLPLVGPLVRKIEVGRFARTLATLLQSGVPLLSALTVTREVSENRILALALGTVQEGAKRGDGLAKPMADSGAFPTLLVHMVRVGEETGRLEEMLGRVAGVYETEIRVAVRRFIALLEPVIILVLGMVVLAIVISILLAILSINDLPL
jgi:general secretion pathway protein F